MKFRTRSKEIDAIQFTGENICEVAMFAEKKVSSFFGSDKLTIQTIGRHTDIFKNDWLIKRTNGTLVFCNDNTFNKIYERVD